MRFVEIVKKSLVLNAKVLILLSDLNKSPAKLVQQSVFDQPWPEFKLKKLRHDGDGEQEEGDGLCNLPWCLCVLVSMSKNNLQMRR